MNDNIRSSMDDFRNMRKLWPYLRPWKGRMIYACLLIPMILLTSSGIPLVIRHAVDDGMLKKDMSAVAHMAIAFLALVLMEYAFRAGQTMLMATSIHKMIRSLREVLVRHIIKLSSRYHDKNLSGALVTRATSDFDNMSESLNHGILTAVVDVAVVVGAIFGLFYLHWQLALAVTLIMPFIVLFVIVTSGAMKSTMLLARVKIASLNAYTQESLIGMTTLKLLTGEGSAAKTIETKAVEYRDAQMKTVILDAAMFAVLDGAASITTGILLWLAISPKLESLGMGAISPGILVAFVSYIGNIFDPLKQLGSKMAMMQGAFTAIDRIFSVLETQEFIKGDLPLQTLSGHLFFKDVSFSYDETKEHRVLKGVSFDVEPGRSLAIVGRTGSGKSTIIRLVSKLYDGYEGEIAIDGRPLSAIDEISLRKQIAIVPQDITLFDGTIAHNISMGHEGITAEKIEASARLVGAHQFIKELPGQYSYQITTAGSSLSHGQKQLIAFARALAKDPKLIILDEATSSVDPASEAMIQSAIKKILHRQTVIVIAHRLSTIEGCDEILVLDHGKVIERGNHRELLNASGVYAGMIKSFQAPVTPS